MPKGIFIGLGGAGVTTVARLKALLFQRAYGSSKEKLDAECTFIFYDTDSASKTHVCNDPELQNMMGPYPVIDLGSEYIDGGSVIPKKVYEYAKERQADDALSERIMEWATDPDVEGHYQLSQEQLSEGAGIQRMAGRCGYVFKREDFEAKIRFGIEKFMACPGDIYDSLPSIWVFSSSNGGTGSSVLLDVLYLVDRLYKRHVADLNPYLRLVLYMPKAFIDKNEKNGLNYMRNSYATLWELNEFRNDAVLNNDGKKFGAFAAQPDRLEWSTIQAPWQVCSYVMAVDVENQNGIRVRLDQMYANTAELCYFLHTGAAGQTMVADLDNDFSCGGPYWGQVSTSVIDPFSWSKFLVGSGFKAIVKADDFLKDYVRTRLRYDAHEGLMGPGFEAVLPTYEERMVAVKTFANTHILSHLMDLDHPEDSGDSSLFVRYKREFDAIVTPEVDNISRNFDPHQFLFDCRKKKDFLERGFADLKPVCLDEIKVSVMKAVEQCIIQFGLRYTYQLLDLVDDEYCERSVFRKILGVKHDNNILDVESEVVETRIGLFGKRKFEMVELLKRYKEACLFSVVADATISILHELMDEPHGLLEQVRNGDATCRGVKRLARLIEDKRDLCYTQYMELARLFAKTKNDVCTDYFPKVSDFVSGEALSEKWVPGHRFEELYSSIAPLGFLKKNPLPFVDMLMGDTEDKEILESIDKCISDYAEDVIQGDHSDVKHWLDQPLEMAFDECFMKEGRMDEVARRNYIARFLQSLSVFYPTSIGSISDVSVRYFYTGGSIRFAEIMGYEAIGDKQYLPDLNLGHRFVVLILALGYSFLDYKYFDMLRAVYEADCPVIENEGSGCHIHKDFVRRDIAAAYYELMKKHSINHNKFNK